VAADPARAAPAEAAAVLLAVLSVLLAIPCALALRGALGDGDGLRSTSAPIAPLLCGAASLWLALLGLYCARHPTGGGR
jgi:hypothetical protein